MRTRRSSPTRVSILYRVDIRVLGLLSPGTGYPFTILQTAFRRRLPEQQEAQQSFGSRTADFPRLFSSLMPNKSGLIRPTRLQSAAGTPRASLRLLSKELWCDLITSRAPRWQTGTRLRRALQRRAHASPGSKARTDVSLRLITANRK